MRVCAVVIVSRNVIPLRSVFGLEIGITHCNYLYITCVGVVFVLYMSVFVISTKVCLFLPKPYVEVSLWNNPPIPLQYKIEVMTNPSLLIWILFRLAQKLIFDWLNFLNNLT